MPRIWRKSGGEAGNAGEGEGATWDIEKVDEELGDPLQEVFCRHISLHGNVFQACVVVTQLTVENNEPLFEVEYED